MLVVARKISGRSCRASLMKIPKCADAHHAPAASVLGETIEDLKGGVWGQFL